MIFEYTAYDKQGEKKKGTFESNSIESAIFTLENGGLIVEKIKEQKSFFQSSLDPALLASISKNLALYIKSGITLHKALGLLKENYAHKKKVYQFLQTLEEAIKKGDSFYKALKDQTFFKIPNFYIFTIDVSEKISGLHSALDELADLINAQEKIKRDVIKAFIYPTFIFLLAVGIVNFMLTSVVPKIVDMFKQTNAELPTITKITLTASHIVQNFGWLITIVGVLSFVGFFMAYKRLDKFRYEFDAFLLSIPLAKDIIITFELSRFSSIMALLLEKGIPYAKALNFSSKTFNNEKLRVIFEQASHEVVEGKSFSNALLQQKALKLPRDFINSVSIGEESSHLSYSLKMISELFAQKNKDKIDIMLALLEPVLMLIIGGMVGFIVISMMLPIFSLSVS
jgi:general secretion pathway protein F